MSAHRTTHALARLERGVTLVELLVTVTIGLLVIAGLGELVSTSVDARRAIDASTSLARDASFVMERMAGAVSHSRRLLLPLEDNPGTNWPEHIREQTVPPSPPIGSSTLATAVLAVTLPIYVDLDFDGVPDADNDGDGLIDEDPGVDNHFDSAPGIMLVDDDGDGTIDEGIELDNDEDGSAVEDPADGVDNDGDGSVDEDMAADRVGDGCSGVCGVDDDRDGSIDEVSSNDDDEDGSSNEDGYDPLVFYLANGTLMERTPVPWNENGISPVDGRDVVVSPLAENVTRLRIERLPGLPPRVDITLELTAPAGQSVTLNRRVRLGASL